MEKPQGIVAILVGDDGREIANATDFNTGSPVGFTQREMQTRRAHDALSMRVVRELASPLLSESIEQHIADRICRKMCENGCRVIIVPIGYDE